MITKLATTLSHPVNAGVPRRHPAHPRGQARERVEVSRKEDGGAVRGEPAAGRHRPQRRRARLLRDGPSEYNTPSMVYYGHLKFKTSVSLRIPLYGSRNLAYTASKMDYMCPL